MIGYVTGLLSAQLRLALRLFADVRFRAPLLIIWVAAFGGALHDAVTSFYYLELCGDKVTVGRIYSGLSFGGLILSPVYGAWMDRKGVFWPLCMSSLCCGLGCAVRGLARNTFELYAGVVILGCGAGGLFTLVLTHISTHSPSEHRSKIVSGYVFQITVLRLLGKGLFPLTNWILLELTGWESDTLPVYRVHMMSCPIFCLFGIAWLLFVDGHTLLRMSADRITEVEQQRSRELADRQELKAFTKTTRKDIEDDEVGGSDGSDSWFFFSVVVAAGACQSFAANSLKNYLAIFCQ